MQLREGRKWRIWLLILFSHTQFFTAYICLLWIQSPESCNESQINKLTICMPNTKISKGSKKKCSRAWKKKKKKKRDKSLPGPKTSFFGQVLFSSACMCPCVCVWVFISIILKSSSSISMKLRRMIYNDEKQVPFEDELNRFIRTEVTENPYLFFFLLRPFDIFFWCYFPFFER